MNKAIPKTQWLGMAKVPFAVPQWVLWGLYFIALLRDPTVISAISWFTLSSLQKPTKSWEVGIGLLPMSHTEEAEARPCMYYTSSSHVPYSTVQIHEGWLAGWSP